jgi:hypothetical protein
MFREEVIVMRQIKLYGVNGAKRVFTRGKQLRQDSNLSFLRNRKKHNEYSELMDYIWALNEALIISGLTEQRFSFGKYMENAICVEVVSSKWVVYIGEKGNKYIEAECNSLKDAFRNVLMSASSSKSEYNQRLEVFQKSLARRKLESHRKTI